jgi:hypothetical protein
MRSRPEVEKIPSEKRLRVRRHGIKEEYKLNVFCSIGIIFIQVVMGQAFFIYCGCMEPQLRDSGVNMYGIEIWDLVAWSCETK